MDIIKAKEEDISGVMYLLNKCIKDMQSNGIDQWDESYPTKDMIAEDIQNQYMYAIKDSKDFVAIVTLNSKGAPEYDTVRWLTEDGKSLFIHRLAILPNWYRKKIATKLMEFAEGYALENNYVSIRLDVYSQNFKGVGLYESCGYQRTGQVHFRNKKPPFFCYEKIL
ncbi:MAG: GNAT family N-acetyltransferase [Planctomycetota bacterium]|jgi:ribosomal protein S18 acetylase RimI-like enzyme